MAVLKKLTVKPTCCLSLQVDPVRAQQINDLAFELGFSRHKLLGLAFNAGLPIVAAQYGHRPTAEAALNTSQIPAVEIPVVNLPAADLPQC